MLRRLFAQCVYIKYSTTNMVWSRGSNARRQWAARFGKTNCANNESSLSLDIYICQNGIIIFSTVFCAAKRDGSNTYI